MAIKNYFSSTGSWAKRVAILAAIGAMGGLLGSCGGSGAGSAPVPVVPVTPVILPLSVLPPTADVFADVPTEISISGGTPPYSIGSSNAVVVPTPALSGTATGGFKITVIAKSVVADTPVTITVLDANRLQTSIALNVKVTTLNNVVTITPLAPTGAGCGGLCSGGDARIVVTAVVNGVKLANRAIRFDVFQGDFRFVTPGTNALVSSLIINTDENGDAVARIQVIVTAPTQVATLRTTDTVSGLVRFSSFNIVQQISGVGILSILPSGPVTVTAGKAAPGQAAQCPFGASVDHYVYGGTPPYTIKSPLFDYLTVFPSIVTTNGGSYRVTQNGCGTGSILVTDSLNRVLESPSFISVAGPAGDAIPAPTPPALTVSPQVLAVGCGQTGSVSLTGFGQFVTNVTTAGIPGGAFTVTPPAGSIPTSVSFTRGTGTGGVASTIVVPPQIPPSPLPVGGTTTVLVNISGATIVPVTVTVPISCP